MFGKRTVQHMIERSCTDPTDRRRFLRSASLAGLGAVGAGALGQSGAASAAPAPSDPAVLNFALNLEYLEAEFYLQAAYGRSLPDSLTGGPEGRGPVTGGRQVHFDTFAVRQYAREIAWDEQHHVAFLRSALGGSAVARPAINIQESFTAAAQAAGLIGPGDTFDPYANEDNFLLAAYLFEDVGVTAYKGAAPLITNKTYLEAAAGILAVEAYHAAIVRTNLFARGYVEATQKISDARDSLDGSATNKDKGLTAFGNIVPTGPNGIAFSRTTGQVLNIVYLTPESRRKGGFFPDGVNGSINTSG